MGRLLLRALLGGFAALGLAVPALAGAAPFQVGLNAFAFGASGSAGLSAHSRQTQPKPHQHRTVRLSDGLGFAP